MAGSGPDWDGLQPGPCGVVALPGSAASERARPPFIAGFDDLQPRAVVSCTAAEEVAQALLFARRHGPEVAARSGGHCFAGFSFARGLVLDVTPLRPAAVADGVVSVGAGARAARLRARAATAVPPGPRKGSGQRWFVLAGPEGNGFCVAGDPDR
jgi:FAD/FMN-containing dehydrogenase